MFGLLKKIAGAVGLVAAQAQPLTPHQEAQAAFADAHRRVQDAKDRNDSRDLHTAQRDLRTARHAMLSAEVWG